MDHRVDKIKKLMEAKRRKRQPGRVREGEKRRDRATVPWVQTSHDEARDETDFYRPQPRRVDEDGKPEPFIKKERIMFQLLASICLVLVTAIIFSLPSGQFDQARQFMYNSFNQEFEFTAVADWYEGQFGRPLALLPAGMETAPGQEGAEVEYASALPATGTIAQSFAQNGRGIYVETELNETVEAVRSGIIRFVGEDEEQEWGKTVVISHYDGGESWYGMLENIQVNLYDHVEAGDLVGYVSPAGDNEEVGVYYFALKEGEAFVDPIDVIPLD
ncbi:M23 family metallopeptidase [Alteribacter natronophilus]|uniref:M23 family metallopeptidase n=1 Tax=Alteribacter natronophilus TaxID=2583810 RepID=UPI00110F0656|nr:M23 family metallopeptidase [Alteribacter natronophilus]TMW71567.1 M23 family metallopeptidase [Alteribacter natronophilus]